MYRREREARAKREEKLASEAERIAGILVERDATLVVVFGSHARGDVGIASDLDMIAVMRSDLPFIKRLEALFAVIHPKVGLDLLVYTPEEFESMRERGFIRHVLAEGRVTPCGLIRRTRAGGGWTRRHATWTTRGSPGTAVVRASRASSLSRRRRRP